jgi:DNA-binding transcriptional MerR regulator
VTADLSRESGAVAPDARPAATTGSESVPIGEFARMARLTVRALRHYHDIDLLHPHHIDPASGYRYYAIDQLRDASLVAVLRSVDVDVATIRAVLHGTVDLAAVLEDERARRNAQARQATTALALLEHLAAADPIEPTVVDRPAHTLFGRRIAVDAVEEIAVVGSAYDELFSTLQAVGIRHDTDAVCIVHAMTRQRLELTIAVHPKDDAVRPPPGIERIDVGAAMTAVVVHHGPLEALTLTHALLARWIHLRDLAPSGPARETYLGELSDQRTEIAVPVEHRG